MTSLKNEFTKTMVARILSFKVWSILLVFVLVATSAGAALADNSDPKGHKFDNTFTKWVTNPPVMEGVVDGDVGPGMFEGEAISMSPGGINTTIIEAIYRFNGSKHAFTAHVIVINDDLTNNATITGDVTDGWLKGASVKGEYKMVFPGTGDCPAELPYPDIPVCFQGELDILVPK